MQDPVVRARLGDIFPSFFDSREHQPHTRTCAITWFSGLKLLPFILNKYLIYITIGVAPIMRFIKRS